MSYRVKSNYKRLGDYIQVVNERNKELEVDTLLGVSIQKVLMPSIANTIGTNMTTYKIIKRNQFAYGPVTSRNGDKISIALLEEHDKAIVSQMYTVFEVIDKTKLNPEYLMMWFRRPEFDRFARFKSHGSTREVFNWEEMCEVELPIPSIEKQSEIVKEYNTIVNRINLNETLNQKLEETAQALYKHWFVDFDFPNEDGEPYKSSGGEMVYCEELEKEIPFGWEVKILGNYCSNITKGTTPEKMFTEESKTAYVKYIKGESLKENHLFDFDKISFIDLKTHEKLKRSKLKEFDICYSIAGSLDKFAIVDKAILPANTNQAIAIIRVDTCKINLYFIIGLFINEWHRDFYRFNVQQAVQANLSLQTISSLPIIIPNTIILNIVSGYMEIIYNSKSIFDKTNRKLVELKMLLLAKMTKEE